MSIPLIILTLSFAGSLGVLFQENRATDRSTKSAFLGLTQLGLFLLAACAVGFLFSTIQIFQDQREKDDALKRNQRMEESLKQIWAKLDSPSDDSTGKASQPSVDLVESLKGAIQGILGDGALNSKNPKELAGANFIAANLEGASFRNANLRRADFREADFSNVDLQNTILDGVQLSKSTLNAVCPKPPSRPTNSGTRETRANVPSEPEKPTEPIDETAVVNEEPDIQVPETLSHEEAASGDQDIVPPRLIRGDQPQYTELARKRRIQGTVELRFIVDEQGNVRDVEIVKDLAMGMGAQAARTVKKWKYEPATQGGSPVAVSMDYSFDFSL